MSAGEDAAEKPHEPTPQKLEEARKKGDIAKSAELNSAAVYLSVLAAALAFGGPALRDMGAGLQGALAAAVAGQGSTRLPTAAAAMHVLGQSLLGAAPLLGVLFAAPAVAVVAALLATRSITFSPDKLAPKLSRLDPVSNAGQKFGATGLVDWARSLVKLVAVCVALGAYLAAQIDEVVTAALLPPAAGTVAFLGLIIGFLGLVVAISVPLGVVDLIWQRFDLHRRNRMSRKDLMDELKTSEGDPMMRQVRRQRGQDIANNRMLDKVATAEVVIVNPTHYAVALSWDRQRGTAPICVAKGVDEIALRIRERALAAGVPVHSDPATARALFATVRLDQEIAPAQYKAVAAAIRFADRIRKVRRR